MTLKCKQVSDLVSRFTDGLLPADKAEQVRLHIEGCACCRAEMAAEQVSSRALSRPMTSFEPPDILAQVKSRVSHRPSARPRWQWASAGLAAACALTWFSLSLMHESPSPGQTPPSVAARETSPTQQPPVLKIDPEQTVTPEKAIRPSKAKSVVAHGRSPKPRKSVVRHTPRPVASPPEIEYMVVYQHPDLGDGVRVATSDGTGVPDPVSAITSSYTIRMTDESTGLVTDVSAYSNSDGETEESATVKFRSDPPNVDEPERSSTDEKPLPTLSGAPRSDMC